MTREEAIKWLESLRRVLADGNFAALWAFAQALDEIIEWLEALQERPKGRWIELPCEIGDTVWSFYDIYDDEEKHFMVDEGKVFAVSIDENKVMWISVRYESGLKYYHKVADIGRSVFFTKEEAEKALADMRESE